MVATSKISEGTTSPLILDVSYIGGGAGPVSVSVSGPQSSVGVAVSGPQSAVQASISGGIGPPILVTESGTSVVGVAGVSPFVAGDNITISATGGSIVFSAANPPVTKVFGRTGEITLQSQDFAAYTASLQGISPVQSVQGRTGAVVLSLTDLTASPAVHTHSTSDVTGLTATIQSAAPVTKVQGRTGSVVLSLADITAAAAVHSHATSDITGLTATIQAAAPVTKVQGRTGSVVLALADITGAAAVHTHTTSDVAGLAATIQAAVPVTKVQGRTGNVVLTLADLTAAAAVHTHSTSDITGLQAASYPDQSGQSGSVLGTDGTAVSWTSRFSIVDAVLLSGTGISLTKNTTAGTISVEAAGGTSGVTVGSATPQPLGTAAAGSSGNASREDHVHAMPDASAITNFATEAAKYGPVTKVQGRTGSVVLSVADLTAAAEIHLHNTGDIVGITTAIQEFSPVKSVQNRTGSVVLTLADLTAAAAVHTHTTSDITGLTATIQAAIPVTKVQGRTGNVVLTLADLTAASAVHTHSTSDITGYSPGAVTSVQGRTGAVTLTITDITAASTAHAASHVAGGADLVLPVVTTVTVTSSGQTLSLPNADILRINSSVNSGTITGLSGGQNGMVKVLYNFSTNKVTLLNQATAASASNRFITFTNGNLDLLESESATCWYDGTSSRWRVI